MFIGGTFTSRLALDARVQPDDGPTPIATGVQSLRNSACQGKLIYYRRSGLSTMIVANKLTPSQTIVKTFLCPD
ncbi:hypothetical protein SBA5_90025 [Candidatus Sulfotelmatomonas gaucii]|uniref:Uncharacterized protein n=1 Tax=Candidatus Sulfuritelmatomonas gaucii TaxID=2043161 RepID=A0A2N9M8B3_9BACT|nr:hypothetical protein SBA5_90025 [Candidatus Sulfotelmatomonas gaucii]